jgi:predicted NBD/HSP70 family sugar kinase
LSVAKVDPWIGPRGSAAGRLLEILRDHGPMTRPEAARLTGMSVGGIRPLVDRLVSDGHLLERPAQAGPRERPGRPGAVLVPMVPDGSVLALDFGHTHVAVAVADLDGQHLIERRAEIDVDHQAGAALDTAATLVRAVVAERGCALESVRQVVAGVPGPVDRAGRIRSTTIVASWWELPIAAEIAARLGIDETAIDVRNDAHLGALGEHRCGAGVGVHDLIYVKASHGLGAGLVLAGELFRGAHGITGELGHAVVEPEGALCRCGSRGCLETVVSVSRIIDQIRFVRGTDESQPLSRAGEHPAARRIVVEAGRALGRALADVCNLVDPALIVVGGELATAGDPLIEGVAESIGRFAQPTVAGVPVVRSVLGERAELVGAVTLAAERARRRAWAIA